MFSSLDIQSFEHSYGKKCAERENAEEPPAPKRLEPLSNPIIEFHINHLLGLLKDKRELADRVVILQHAIQIVNAGANPRFLQWHLKYIKKALPNEEELLEAADLLIECIEFGDVR